MALVLFDTNILVDALKNYREALEEVAHWDEPAISAITWMEIYAGATPKEFPALDVLIRDVGFEVIHTDDEIARSAAKIRGDSIRNKPKIALPDAIIMATGQEIIDDQKRPPAQACPHLLPGGASCNKECFGPAADPNAQS